jgi:hypothetical protein
MLLKKIFTLNLAVLLFIPGFSYGAGLITLSPAKHEIILKPGAETIRKINITNNLGRDATFSINIEDFIGTRDLNNPVILLDDKLGPYSLKNYIFPSATSVRLKSKEQYTLSVKIKVPPEAPPGGLYGAVLVSADNDTESTGTAKISTRLGSLFFVKIDGPIKESGELRKFNSVRGSWFFGVKPVLAQIVYENTGNIYLNPYAQIEIRNWFGRPIETIKIDPWYVLPGAIRNQTVEWNYSWLSFGSYEFSLYLNKGYQNQVTMSKFTVWVFPWPIILLVILIILSFVKFKKFRV